MNLAKISTKVTFWSQEEEELNSLVNRLLLRGAERPVPTSIFYYFTVYWGVIIVLILTMCLYGVCIWKGMRGNWDLQRRVTDEPNPKLNFANPMNQRKSYPGLATYRILQFLQNFYSCFCFGNVTQSGA